jgi:hypothetical protein
MLTLAPLCHIEMLLGNSFTIDKVEMEIGGGTVIVDGNN